MPCRQSAFDLTIRWSAGCLQFRVLDVELDAAEAGGLEGGAAVILDAAGEDTLGGALRRKTMDDPSGSHARTSPLRRLQRSRSTGLRATSRSVSTGSFASRKEVFTVIMPSTMETTSPAMLSPLRSSMRPLSRAPKRRRGVFVVFHAVRHASGGLRVGHLDARAADLQGTEQRKARADAVLGAGAGLEASFQFPAVLGAVANARVVELARAAPERLTTLPTRPFPKTTRPAPRPLPARSPDRASA